MSKVDEGSAIQLHLARCTSEALVTTARLRTLGKAAEPGDDVIVWEIRSEAGAPLDKITVGALPPGFDEVVPLAAIPPNERLVVDVDPGLGSEDFVLEDLRSEVSWGGEYLSPAVFRDRAQDRGACNPTFDFSTWRSFLRLLAAIGAGVLGLAMLGGAVLWRRKRRRPEG